MYLVSYRGEGTGEKGDWGRGGAIISKRILNIVSRINKDSSMLHGNENCAYSNHHKHWRTAHHPKNWKIDTYYPTTDARYWIVTVV